MIYRNELKFLVSDFDAKLLENKIKCICQKDAHAYENSQYNISSLYFDTLDDRYYGECKAGVNDRKKYRIRVYNGSKKRISLECKFGLNGKKRKETFILSESDYNDLINGEIPEAERNNEIQNGMFSDFCAEIKKGLKPKVVVSYNRTALVYPIGNVRITFDREITARPYYSLFDERVGGIPVMLPGSKTVVEVKYDDVLPQAIRSIFAVNEELRPCSFSKYALCRDALEGMIIDYFE